jgi:undecaprenyl-diphosphatase
MATPAIFAIMPSNEWLTVGTMYLETMLIANGIKEWTKLLVYRARPYMYFDGYPEDKLEDGDWNCSFPSGHTTMAFAGAAFTTMVFCQCFPDSNWKYAVAGASFGIAAVTGALRMASGNHFLTDVIVGAVLGTACGFAVPYMHTKNFYGKFETKSGKGSASVTPSGLVLSISF